MKGKRLVPFLVIGALLITSIAGLAAYKTVQAATPTPAATSAAGSTLGHGAFGHFGVTDQQLATALGIDVTALQSAYTTATNDVLAQAVSDGLITQAQADEIKASGDRFGDLGPYKLTGIDLNAALAKALGISEDKLTAAYQTAYNATIDQQVTDGVLTQTQADLLKGQYALANSAKFQSAMQDAFTAAVNQAVSDGTITQSQADQILQNNSNLNFFGGRGFGGPGGGPGGGRGGHGMGPGNTTGDPNSTTPGATPTTTGGA
jgi:hypothetical protein